MHCQARTIDPSEALPAHLSARQLEPHGDFPPHPIPRLVISAPFSFKLARNQDAFSRSAGGPIMALTRRFLAPTLATLVLLVSNSPLRAQEVNWRHGFAEARREAEQSGRLLFLDFGTQACVYCQKLDATTFRNPGVARMLNENFIPVHIDANREQDLTRRMGVQRFPTLVITDPTGRTIDRREGFLEAGPMMGFLDQGNRVASAPARPQFRAQARDDRIPARALAIEEPVRRPQPELPAAPVAVKPELLHLPSPEELGISAEKPAAGIEVRAIDWAAVHARLNRLGASCFQVQHPTSQLVRIVSMFPQTENRIHRIEASATTEAEAVRLFIEQVDEWSAHP
jgi:thioredoxin-related protein